MSALPQIAVALCARNPDSGRLTRVLDGLLRQDLPAHDWEFLLVDNGSSPPLTSPAWPSSHSVRLVAAPTPGLFHARLAAIGSTQAPFLVFIDDDTIPEPGFLRALHHAFTADPQLTCLGPRILPRYDQPPPPWLSEFDWALAIRDLGPRPLTWALADGLPLPPFTPIGAGLALRTNALAPYLAHARVHEPEILARSWIGQGCGGTEDKDLVLTLLRAGGRVGYIPAAVLHHLIPASRMAAPAFEKLLPGLGYLWVRTLHAHALAHARPVSRFGAKLRTARAWFRHRAWQRPVGRLRWLYSAAIFRGLAENARDPFRYPHPADSSQATRPGI